MKTPPGPSYLRQIVILVILNLAVAAVGGLSLVWLRQEVSKTAQSCLSLRTTIDTESRLLSELKTRIAAVQSPEALVRRAERSGLVLIRPRADQMVRLDLASARRVMDRNARSLAAQATDPVLVTFDLALMEPVVHSVPGRRFTSVPGG